MTPAKTRPHNSTWVNGLVKFPLAMSMYVCMYIRRQTNLPSYPSEHPWPDSDLMQVPVSAILEHALFHDLERQYTPRGRTLTGSCH